MEEERKDVVQEPAVKPVEEAPEVDGVTMLKEATSAPEKKEEEPKVEKVVEAPKVEVQEVEVKEEKPAGPTKEEVQREIDKYLSQKGSPATAIPTYDIPKVVDENGKELTVDELYEAGRVREAVEIQGAKIVSQVFEKLSGQTQQNEALKVRQEANRAVYEKHPELLAIDQRRAEPTPFAIEIAKVYQEFPHLRNTDPRGPIAAMEIAEARVAAKGGDVVKPVKNKEVPKEAPKVEPVKPVAEVTNDIRDQAIRAASIVTTGGGGAAPAVQGPELADSEKLIASRLGLTEEEYKAKKKNEPVFNASYYAKYRNSTDRPTRGGSQ